MDLDVDLCKYGAPRHKRIEEIKKRCAESKSNISIDFLGRHRDIPIIELRIEYPMYRLANGRTVSLQEEFLVLNPDKPNDFFNRDLESTEAQIEQHRLLHELAKEASLYETFKNGAEQDDPIICAHDGVVVNGNRRLCAWRDLYYEDKEKYSHFQMVRIAILPECDEKAITDLEARLQIKKDIKADYQWHAIANMIKHLLSSGQSESDIAKLYGIKVSRLRELSDMREYAETYLEQRSLSKQWSQVNDKEYAFKQMVKNRKRTDEPDVKEVIENVSFAFIDNSSDAGERIYDTIPDVGIYIEEIVAAVDEHFKTTSEIVESGGDTDLLSGKDNAEKIKRSKVAILVAKSENSSEIRRIAKGVIETQRSLSDERESTEYLINQVRKANSNLCSAAGILAEKDDQKDIGLAEQIEAIEANLNIIKDWFNKRHAT